MNGCKSSQNLPMPIHRFQLYSPNICSAWQMLPLPALNSAMGLVASQNQSMPKREYFNMLPGLSGWVGGFPELVEQFAEPCALLSEVHMQKKNTNIQINHVIAWDDLYSLLQRWIRNHIAMSTLAKLIFQPWLFQERILFQNLIVVTTGQRATIVVGDFNLSSSFK